MLMSSLTFAGPRVIDFANILKYGHLPLSETINFLLRLFKEAMGSPVEMEFAVDLTPGAHRRPTFYLLQIKPLIRREEQIKVDLQEVPREKMLLFARRAMGNGRVQGIRDVVYVVPETFDKTSTRDIAQEISLLNKLMEEQKREYILIGPGRWGTRDPFTGIPVLWAQISKARVIVEMGLEDFPLDSSLGSHFFHNVTSMNVGYFSIPHQSRDAVLNAEIFGNQELISQGKYVRHIRFNNDLTVLMDGRKREALIFSEDPPV